MKYKLGFIGVGVMAGAILNRVVANLFNLKISTEDIIIYDTDFLKMNEYSKQGIARAHNSNEVLSTAEIVFLGVKPQQYKDILVKSGTINAKAIVSIMAGVKTKTLRENLSEEIGVVRAMPNTPSKIAKGATALYFSAVSEEHKQFVIKLFSCSGKVLTVSEDKFDAVTSISGSGPAYVFLFAKGLIEAGVEGGLTHEEATALALQTIEGASALATESCESLDFLIDSVCSKGGTTIEAVESFNADNFCGIIKKAVKACREKSKSLNEI
ncbi:MAG: pyrroline-5-carboxylate reductase [Firmicutes bacterium]|nr:pyrroline-5-carboxylate reductase [Bacillota bacterium]